MTDVMSRVSSTAIDPLRPVRRGENAGLLETMRGEPGFGRPAAATGDGTSAGQPAGPPASLHYSGVLVTALPGRLEEARAGAARLPGVEVRHVEPASGRFVVVLESVDRRGQEDGLRALSALDGVAAADLVTHFVDDETEPGPREKEEETP